MLAWKAVYSLAFWPLLFASCAMQWRAHNRGGAIPATIMIAGYLVGYLALSRIDYRAFEGRLAATDTIMFAALAWSATRWSRWPLIFIAASQLLVVTGHFGKLIEPGMTRLAYAIVTGGAAYFQVICLNIELWRAIRCRRLRKHHPV